MKFRPKRQARPVAGGGRPRPQRHGRRAAASRSAAAGSALVGADHLHRDPAALERRRRAARSGRSTARRSQRSRRARCSARTARPAPTRTRARTAASSATSTASRPTGGKTREPNYTISKTVFFTGSTNTGCGQASTDVGPFYCPVDKKVYIDLGFFDELAHAVRRAAAARSRRRTCSRTSTATTCRTCSASSTRSATTGRARTARSVRTELQADCFAGVWANHAAADRLPDEGHAGRRRRTRSSAAAAVGDDRIQKETQGRVEPRDVDARLVGAARAVVHDRLADRRPEPLQHVRLERGSA